MSIPNAISNYISAYVRAYSKNSSAIAPGRVTRMYFLPGQAHTALKVGRPLYFLRMANLYLTASSHVVTLDLPIVRADGVPRQLISRPRWVIPFREI